MAALEADKSVLTMQRDSLERELELLRALASGGPQHAPVAPWVGDFDFAPRTVTPGALEQPAAKKARVGVAYADMDGTLGMLGGEGYVLNVEPLAPGVPQDTLDTDADAFLDSLFS